MSTNDTEPSPWTRPSFITAAIVVAIVVMLGAALAIRALTHDDANAAPPEPTASTSASVEPSSTPTPDEGAAGTDASICGLKGVKTTGTVTIAPTTEWAFQGTTAYPISPEFGPGQTDSSGARYCFQHSPEGALFMAANAVVQGSDPTTASTWGPKVLAEGQYREQLLDELGNPSDDTESNSRQSIVGFRVLAYDGATARIDIAVRATFETTVTVSGVYELVWQGGDWKLSSDVTQPLNVAAIPDLAGYVSWGAA